MLYGRKVGMSESPEDRSPKVRYVDWKSNLAQLTLYLFCELFSYH
jgi:hypothetical protein